MSSDSPLPSARARTGAARAAWRRWEMHEVSAPPARRAAEPAPQDDIAPAPSDEAVEQAPEPAAAGDIDQLLEQLMEQARQQGHAAGFAAGLAEGRQTGHAQGHAEGLQAGLEQALAEQNRRAAQLDAMLSSAEQALSSLDTQVAQGIVDLALRLARQVVQATPALRPEALLDTVRELLQPQEGQLSWIRLRIHPDDHDMLAQYFRSLPAPPPWQLLTDDGIEPGGCLLETSLGQIDATLQTRWQRVAGSLGPQAPAWGE